MGWKKEKQHHQVGVQKIYYKYEWTPWHIYFAYSEFLAIYMILK